VPGQTLDVLDSISLSRRGGSYVWTPPICDDCDPSRGFQSDPTGQYLVIGLDRGDDGYSKRVGFFAQAEPRGIDYHRALSTIERGKVEQAQDQFAPGLMIGLAGGIAVLLILPGLALRERRLRREAQGVLTTS
jgi:hypothetical protein